MVPRARFLRLVVHFRGRSRRALHTRAMAAVNHWVSRRIKYAVLAFAFGLIVYSALI